MESYSLKPIAVLLNTGFDLITSKKKTILLENKVFHWYIDTNFTTVASDVKENPDFNFELRKYAHFTHLCLCISIPKSPLNVPKNVKYNASRQRLFDLLSGNVEKDYYNFINIYNDSAYKFYKTSTQMVYDLIQEKHEDHINSIQNAPSETIYRTILNLKLRSYQENAVQWLINRESLKSEALSPDILELNCIDTSKKLYVNRNTLQIVDEPSFVELPTGGILADEMGLGKTIEILSLILLNRRKLKNNMLLTNPDDRNDNGCPPAKKMKNDSMKFSQLYCVCKKTNKKSLIQCTKCLTVQHRVCVAKYEDDTNENYKCPECWSLDNANELIKSSATVIVSPQTIANQWLTEITKHSKFPLKILYYPGIAKTGWINPEYLSKYDIILTDYNVLKKEIYYLNDKSHDLRSKKKYMKLKSPLLMIEWWRVCLDEAQMVENITNIAAQMVKLLPVKHRWAVTGTPIHKSIDDLRGLLEFLGVKPFYENHNWKKLITSFYDDNVEPLIGVLSKIMWRTSKDNVLDEIGLPPQTYVTHYVKMSDVEKLFYRDEHNFCAEAFEEKVAKYATKLTTLSHLTTKMIKLILDPFKKLRQMCAAPAVYDKSQQNMIRKRFLLLSELIEHLKVKNEQSCKTALRTMASSLNGIAAAHIITNKYDSAKDCYERVLKLAKDNSEAICVDSLLQIHALHNLVFVMKKKALSCMGQIAVNEYENECVRLEWKYLEPYYNNLNKAKANAVKCTENVLKYLNNISGDNNIGWWHDIAKCFYKSQAGADALLSRINEEKRILTFESPTMFHSDFKTIDGVIFSLKLWINKVIKCRMNIKKQFSLFDKFIENMKPRNEISTEVQNEMKKTIQSVFNCHLSNIRDEKPQKIEKKKGICNLCKIKELLSAYECIIFNKIMLRDETSVHGDWNPSFQETVCRILFAFGKSKSMTKACEEGEIFLQCIEAFKKEHKENSKLWIEIEYTIKAYDELDMCKMRLNVDFQENDENNREVLRRQVQEIYVKNKLTLISAQADFNQKLARSKYINHLLNKDDIGNCPICKSEDYQEYSVLECGHHLCIQCLKGMSEHHPHYLRCVVCRNRQNYKDVYLATKKVKDDDIRINGDFSSKVEEILRTVVKLKRDEENVKILVFSNWYVILRVIEDALVQNNIKCKKLATSKNISEFKDNSKGITCLLLPLSQGGKGLNLTEATHVFLVEPILDPSEELQAVGRVHRIGQSKPTTVHRFILKETIEEAIYNATSNERKKTWNKKDLDIEYIRKLFSTYNC